MAARMGVCIDMYLETERRHITYQQCDEKLRLGMYYSYQKSGRELTIHEINYLIRP